ncbi:HslU--HslV peptidase ATPase subunit [Helicobacter pylori]|uniref:ATP-dependent protease ATPase subunit HslU n=1 Tax=Helicobacter pylori (strain J99 / ATCC 700824) TaxID=85963 RepID=HSLU_HELPJ|nr:HslU--HslV peptidase ATPase subunit [Helicobacter pylori]Q9ZLW1.1 RecName: Full=ATP-dependent protease ATPase subunit HslU; AltName: Full=Unfoldase HslU [Helicobacter pylori J99]AAD06034.1 HEAT SHOCK PROTEIN [Helicobacter pylori J99]AKE81545.1 ATP-dependent protease [Helicobacter pylori J99]AVL49082.1 HslU--HslV peptidase ATPase subunit [Helicobacter pylori]MWR19628.1 HslU--HslV peptidase ATPase subunit [Helicobacter pylori]MWR35405.1 HslU--HslV peptidase ATPase subunit [Helicobacter pylor
MSKLNMTPREIVAYLDEYIIEQKEAKKFIAIALRNRYRRLQLEKSLQEEITPKNILMIGSTGVGKTEIARRMAKIMKLPFVKVEASKYTEVGFVGRDVESMVRDLVNNSVLLVENEHKERLKDKIEEAVVEKIAKKLLPPLPSGVSEEKKQEYANSLLKMQQRIAQGELDSREIEIEVRKKSIEIDSNVPPEILRVQENLIKVFHKEQDKVKKTLSVKEAKEALKAEISDTLLDGEAIKMEGLKRAESSGVIFIDEIDKIAVSSKEGSRQDPSKEGVQRDLLPIVEGSVVNTKYGSIKTEHILFIAAGAFHLSKPSDLIPELQGRFPLRVELENLTEEIMYMILTQTKTSIIKQYQALLKVEGVEIAFEDDAIKELAKLSYNANQKSEDIGARRLHTTIEKVLEDISFEAEDYSGQSVTITKELVQSKLGDLVADENLVKYIL